MMMMMMMVVVTKARKMHDKNGTHWKIKGIQSESVKQDDA